MKISATIKDVDENLPKTVLDVPLSPPTENLGKQIILFGKEVCPDCSRVRKFLADNAITYEYHDLDLDKPAQKWINSFTTHCPVLITLDKQVLYTPSNDQLFQIIKSTSVNEKVSEVAPQVFDTIIIGAGPAGITAAIYAVRKSLKVLVIAKNIGGQAIFSGDIENYPGFTMITGSDLAFKFKDEVSKFANNGIWIKEGQEVTAIEGAEGDFTVKTAQSSYKSKTVIVASGRNPRYLGIKGEKELLGKGVATCATCDGPLYKGKEVVVVGGGNSALDAAFSLLKIAKLVTIVNITENVNGDQILLKNVTTAPNVKILNNTTVTEVVGKNFVEGVKVQDKTTHQEQTISVSGMFIEIGWIPSVDFIPQLAKDKQNQVIVDEFGETSVPGIWAAGDVNNLWGEQIVIAAGEGAKVALAVAEHIAKIPHQATSNMHMGA